MSVLRLYKLVHFGDVVNLVFSIDNVIAIHTIMTLIGRVLTLAVTGMLYKQYAAGAVWLC